MMPQNTNFDSSGAPTILVDSKINKRDENQDFATRPATGDDEEVPF